MFPFEFEQAQSVQGAVAALRADGAAQALAGGMTLLPAMKQRQASPTRLVCLEGIEAMRGLRREGRHLRIGAMVRHGEVATSAVVGGALPALARLAGRIGDPQVRNRGTLGGSIANNDPAADYTAALLGLDAIVHTDRRDIAADTFFTGRFATALSNDELVVSVSFLVPERAAYVKFANPVSGYAIVGVMVAQVAGSVRVAVTGAAEKVYRVPSMELALARRFAGAALDGATLPRVEYNEDMHASADYRAHLVTVLARRAVEAAGG
jgi:carbon-monoxide dehydrogenase medium subunit